MRDTDKERGNEMDNTVEAKTVNGKTVRIVWDPDPESPREWDNLGTMVCWHRRYNLGDKSASEQFRTPQEFDERPGQSSSDVVLPLFLYDHSGLHMKVGSFQGLLPQGHAEFDSMQVGYIFVTAEKLRSEYGWKKITAKRHAEAIKYLEAEVSTYDDFLSGQVYGYEVEDAEGDLVDSCYGIYGLAAAREEAERAVA